jgi:c-di-GMP-binding flagellar brake protein YcgR
MTMKETDTGTEKRQYPRVETRIPVRYKKQSDAAETPGSGSLTGDVSEGGLKLSTKEVISAACNLSLELDIPTLTQPIRATSKVAWIKNANTGEDYEYEVGNEFMEITKKDQELISQYINSLR